MKTEYMFKRYNIISELEWLGVISKEEMEEQIREIEDNIMAFEIADAELKEMEKQLFQ